MGGLGSGQGAHKGSKATVEEAPSIDIMALRRSGFLVPGASGRLQWTWRPSGRRSSIAFAVLDRDRLAIKYASRHQQGEWHAHLQPLGIDWTPCPFGGERPWLVCPTCGRRTACLYLNKALTACRVCAGLSYRSQHLDRPDRLRQRALKRKERAGGHGPGLDLHVARPKGAWLSRWFRDWEAYAGAVADHGRALNGHLGALACLRPGERLGDA
jgi:hypothetical protein